MTSAATAVNHFSHRLFQTTDDGEVALAPASISLAMGMAYAGADGATADEIATVFHYPDEAIHALGALQTALGTRKAEFEDGKSLELNLVNDLWVQEGHSIGEAYQARMAQAFDAAARPVDFEGSPDDARRVINSHIAEQTRDKISELLSEGMITEQVRAVLTNAIYLEAPWMHPFEQAATNPGTFHAPEGDVEVSMMWQCESFRTFSGDGFEALELPFEGDTLATIVVLPDAGRIQHVASDLDADRFAQMLDGLEYTYTDIRLPRFTVRKHLSLRTVLEDMGMPGAFSRDANFDDISPEFSIDEVIHETYIDVDEYGTQAAAASAVVMFGRGAPEDPTPFVVDRPFLFYIVDNASGAILFAARISDPSLNPETRSGLA